MLFAAIASLAALDLERLRPLTRRAALLGLGASIATSGSQRPAFAKALELDPDYPGTAVERMQAVRQRAASLTPSELSRDWSSSVRPRLLWAAGMRDLRDAAPGQGYTGHAFNDAIHVDAHSDSSCVYVFIFCDPSSGIQLHSQQWPRGCQPQAHATRGSTCPASTRVHGHSQVRLGMEATLTLAQLVHLPRHRLDALLLVLR